MNVGSQSTVSVYAPIVVFDFVHIAFVRSCEYVTMFSTLRAHSKRASPELALRNTHSLSATFATNARVNVTAPVQASGARLVLSGASKSQSQGLRTRYRPPSGSRVGAVRRVAID